MTFPGEDSDVSNLLHDYGAVFDARVFDQFEQDLALKLSYSDLGRAVKFEAFQEESFFVGIEEKSEDQKRRLEERIDILESAQRRAAPIMKFKYENRLDSIIGNMVLVKIGTKLGKSLRFLDKISSLLT